MWRCRGLRMLNRLAGPQLYQPINPFSCLELPRYPGPVALITVSYVDTVPCPIPAPS